MSNENSNKKSGPDGTFRVRLKKPETHDIYLKSDNSGNLTWDSTGTGTDFTGTTTDPSTWTFTPTGGKQPKYLTKVAQPGGTDDKVEWSGGSSDGNWAFSSNQLSYGSGAGKKYLKHNGNDKSPTLASTSTTEIVIES